MKEGKERGKKGEVGKKTEYWVGKKLEWEKERGNGEKKGKE